MDFKDYYATLGVAEDRHARRRSSRPSASWRASTIRTSIRATRPPKRKFKEINEAYEVLGDPRQRKKYDELGANWRMYEQAGARGRPNPFGGGCNVGGSLVARGGFRTMTPGGDGGAVRRLQPVLRLLHHVLRRRRRFRRRRGQARARGGRGRAQRPGRDIEHEIELALEDAYHGATRRLALQHDGQREARRRADSRRRERRLARARRAAKASKASAAPQSGDLYLRVRLTPHPHFERKGRDLYVKVPVPVTTAVLGGEAEVPTLVGQAGAAAHSAAHAERPGVPAEGIRHAGRGQGRRQGDLYARVTSSFRRALSDRGTRTLRSAQRNWAEDDSKKHSAA